MDRHAMGWFFSPSSSEMRRDNAVEWLLWALFSSTRDNRLDEWKEEIEGYIEVIERLLGHELQDGYNDSINAFVETSPHPSLAYWYRPHRSKTKRPIVFFHGIGIGLWTYVQFFRDILRADPDVGIIAFEDLSVSMRISPPPLRREELLDALPVVLDHHRFDKFVLMGHSYGTVVQAHIMRSPELAQRVTSWLFIDPIPFLLHQPAVAYNFVYRQPQTANEWQLWYFASRDPDIARVLARYFFWTENILFKEDLVGRRVGVVVGGCDQIVDAEELRRYLTEEDEPTFKWESKDGLLQVLWYPPLDHAQVFDTPERRSSMVTMLSGFVREAEAPVVNGVHK
ncbi:hypothetical protein EIP86_006929 [Pleurotus ostreatoroseus]|nr:hypothetical protein EIP86_006929 [Pleurotus ostreatoroseus]